MFQPGFGRGSSLLTFLILFFLVNQEGPGCFFDRKRLKGLDRREKEFPWVGKQC